MSSRKPPVQPREAGSTFHKPVSALAIVPVNRSLTVTARKVYNVMGRLAQAEGDTREEGYAAPLHAILHQSGTDSSATASAKRYLKEMMTTIIEWRQLSPGDVMPGEAEREQVFTLLSQADFYKVGRENWVRWWYPPAIKRQMLDPERWAQINLETVARLGTYCAVALYEICARYQGVGRTMRQDWTWWLPVLRGTDQSKLREWRKFKNEFVTPALRNINELSEIDIELVEHKKNGKFSGEVQFLVRRKDQRRAVALEDRQPVDVTVQGRALALDIREHDFDALAERYGQEAVARALDTLAQHVASAKTPVVNRLSHLRWLLGGVPDKRAPAATSTALPAPRPNAPVTPAVASAKQPEATLAQEKLAEAEQAFAALPREEQFRWLQRLREDLVARGVQLTPLLRSRLDAGQWQAPAVRSWLLRFYASQFDKQD
ncbi:replication initiation protein [Azohydromonas caseinilytica]|uniref:RepB family plasmid replication initiator protein n=1 Tax=Azohydromonas caseinilytica TaxID=2728836 RepID=A0A848FIN8_9BURK|nr:replication initiation protein [Azohydromonas caseinilytica]NML18139.1 RepB family plasmid replication initiator protein [Azohydromonas caseinilytica]